MGLLNIISNEVKAAIGYQQGFADLLAAKDVTRALSMMKSHAEEAANNLREYEVSTHKVMERKDRAVYDKKGNFLRWSSGGKFLSPTLSLLMKFRWFSSMADLLNGNNFRRIQTMRLRTTKIGWIRYTSTLR